MLGPEIQFPLNFIFSNDFDKEIVQVKLCGKKLYRTDRRYLGNIME